MKDKPAPSYKYFAHKWVRSQTTRGYISPYATPAYPGLRRYKSTAEPSPPVVPSTSPPLPNNPRTRSYLSSLIPNPHQYGSPYNSSTMAPPSRTQRAKRPRKNGPSKSNKPVVLAPPIPSPPSATSASQQPQDPRYSLTYILNSPTLAPHNHITPARSLQSLPEKIRHLIWSYARSRTICITISNDLIYSRSPSPITLRINRESRSATIHHYSAHPRFYILGTQHENKERIHYPFFDPSVDSVVLNGISMDHTSALSSAIFGFYESGRKEVAYRKREVFDCAHMDILHSLHIPARVWDWNRIQRAPRAEIRFRHLSEIVLEGGAMGLRTEKDVKKCKALIRECFEKNVEEIDDMDGVEFESHGLARTANVEIKDPEVRVIMPNGLDHEWMFEEDELGMESMEERAWVMNFISKVKASR
ncbi:uncharacterized protein EAE97_010553 [Botrytis byssoidea]|uniref:2EXR domain-containing protein n=1 Tax=Botrytis byssoidea TaxID=139641 RepID=A0A9P5I300_9HELO|nr:uncharacterized protein EAE97_010553 [Botrytis byssoidea]KAF7925472.1 hypothetical protein EAE97_010553 [Botrytis byssoidea]